mgnify:CR=1 FL=1
MSDLSPEIIESIIDACKAGASDAGTSLSIALDSAIQIVDVASGNLPIEGLGPGLAIVFEIGDACMALLLPEATNLLPTWYAAPDATGESKLQTLAQELATLAGPDGLDVIYDPVGGDYAEPSLRAAAWNGRFLVVGFPAGIPKIPLNLPLLKNCQIVGVFWGAFTRRDPDRYAAHKAALFDLYAAGHIRPRISDRFPLEDAAKALRLIETRKAMGKIVLTLD